MVVAKRFVYVLRSIPALQRYYVGLTSDVESRLVTHNSGGSRHSIDDLRPLAPQILAALANAQRGRVTLVCG